jgi:hypothetical protein
MTPKKIVIPFWVGDYFHKGLEEFYSHTRPAAIVKPIIQSMEKDRRNFGFLTPEDEEKMDLAMASVEGMLTTYFEYYAGDLKKWKVIKPELKFEIPLMDNIVYVGKMDLLVENLVKGGQYVVENKTAGRIDKGYVDRLPIDFQITGYAIGAKAVTGVKTKAVIYNVIKKPELRQRSGESIPALAKRIVEDYKARPEMYFYRKKLLRSKEEKHNWREEVKSIGFEMSVALAKLDLKKDVNQVLPTFYRNTASCTPIGRPCQFLKVCTQGWNKETASEFRIRESFNPEFAEKEGESL